MSDNQKKRYIKEFRAFLSEVNSSEAKAKSFYNKAGITTPTGKLKKSYTNQSS